MEKRENVLTEALEKNAEETEKWKNYLEETKVGIENLKKFIKHLDVDVMVPLGKKAFMPGKLIHTNEILVSHYQGYFSKCSTNKAREICELRIENAKEHVKKLEAEAELWQNKLQKPYVDGVLPVGEKRDIIEDYDEQKEEVWRAQHRERMRQAKLKEKIERDRVQKSDEEVFKMLEEAELMEELEQELDSLEINDMTEEIINKLISGDMKVPKERNRISYEKQAEQGDKCLRGKENEEKQGIVKKDEIIDIMPATNNNILPNPELRANNQLEDRNSDEELPEEIKIITEQAKFLNPFDQIGFYDYQLQIIRRKLSTLPLKTPEQLDEKIRLFTVLEHLEDLLETAEEFDEDNTDKEDQDSDTGRKDMTNENHQYLTVNQSEKMKSSQKRRISFALEDETLEFRKNEAVTQMKIKPLRDVIQLDNVPIESQVCENESLKENKKDLIKSKVEQNLQFIEENQSKQDFDMVEQILKASMAQIKTLHIKFQHSAREPKSSNSKDDDNNQSETYANIPGTPADFYNRYMESLGKENESKFLYLDSYTGEDQVKAPILREVDRQKSFEDPKLEFSRPAAKKSILRNKKAVKEENHYPDSDITKKKSKANLNNKSAFFDDEEYMSAYNKVMNDVMEKPLIEPEPLPKGKFIDAHAPKKRISRFKQMRMSGEEEV
uniref:Unconventional prefoldin RPB5 interactor n=1 Tax=Glossina morsitans morsitans TaxID=37546 RepID=A0A1B0FN01_GLOMM